MPKNREPPENHSARLVKIIISALQAELRVLRSYLKDPEQLRRVITQKTEELRRWKRNLKIAEEGKEKDL